MRLVFGSTHPRVPEWKDDGGETVQRDGSAGGQLEVGGKVVEDHDRQIRPECRLHSDSKNIFSHRVNDDLKPARIAELNSEAIGRN